MRRYGFFKNKRIVLYDTLIEQCREPEVVAVLAHELGRPPGFPSTFTHCCTRLIELLVYRQLACKDLHSL